MAEEVRVFRNEIELVSMHVTQPRKRSLRLSRELVDERRVPAARPPSLSLNDNVVKD